MTRYATDEMVPRSVEAEQAVLGGVILDPDTYIAVTAVIQASDFFIERHAWIWEAIVNLKERRDALDYLTLIAELENQGRLGEVGGSAYVLSLVNKTPSALNVEGYAVVVKRMAIRRNLLGAAQTVARIALSEETDIEEVQARAEEAIFGVTREARRRQPLTNAELVSRHVDQTLMLRANPDMVAGVPTGLYDLDAMLGGFKPGQFVLIGARPGMGKSALLENFVRAAAKEDIPALFVSMEMFPDELVSRQVAAEGGINLSQVLKARYSEGDFGRYAQTADRLAQLPIITDYSPRLTPAELRATVQRAVMEFGVGLVAIDYIQLMHARGYRSGDSRVQELSYISRECKAVAGEFEVPVIAAAQLSRSVEGRNEKRPLLSDLRESGSLEQDADIVMFPFRPSYYNEELPLGDAELNIAKHRNGSTGLVNLVWQGEYVRFVSAQRRTVDLRDY